MKAIPSILATAAAIALASCAGNNDPYDTGNVYGFPDASYSDNTAPADAGSPLYDTPAVYDEQTPPPAATPAEPADASAYFKTHTVGRGDTLSGISAKYKVPKASIIKANNIKNPDLMVLGTKLIIPNR